MVRGTVEETLNAMLDAEADELCNAQRYEHSPDRVDTRAGHYKRKLHTKAGEVGIKMPKLRQQTFDTANIERYRRRDISIEEAIVQMCLTRRISAAGRRHHGNPVGDVCVFRDGVQSQPEGVQAH